MVFPVHHERDSDNMYQSVTIQMQAPHLYMRYNLSRQFADQEDKMRLAMAELKVEMIKALIDGEWELIDVDGTSKSLSGKTE